MPVASIKDEQTFICRECNAGFENEFHLQHHKDNYHELSFTILAAPVSKKHDEVDSGASVEEKHMTRLVRVNSIVQLMNPKPMNG